jgi:4-hydroxybenzoate polyprenyltransferase
MTSVRFPSVIRNFAELGRVSNLPTTFSNVLVGSAIGIASGGTLRWWVVALLWLAIASFYVAGMALNDLADASVDAQERPGRPIPSGRVSRRGALAFILGLFFVGLGLLSIISLLALAAGTVLVSLIVIYDLIHLHFPGSVIFMGLCRGLIYVIAAIAMRWPPDWTLLGPFAGAITIYTVSFTVIARSETKEQLDLRKWISILIPIIVIVPAIILRPSPWHWTIAALVLTLAWLVQSISAVFATPLRTREAVMTWISGFCLIDGLYLTLLNQPWLAAIASACFVLTVLSQRRIAGT